MCVPWQVRNDTGETTVCTVGVGALDDPFYSPTAVRTKLSGVPFSVILIVAGDYQLPIGSIK